MTAWFDQLRFLLHVPPSRPAWETLLRHAASAPEQEAAVGLTYAWDHLQAWPAEQCVAPATWLRTALKGEPPPAALALCRRWKLLGEQVEAGSLARLVEQLERLRRRFVPQARLEELSCPADRIEGDAEGYGVLLRSDWARGLRVLQLWPNHDIVRYNVDPHPRLIGDLAALEDLRWLQMGRLRLDLEALLGAPWWPRLEHIELRGSGLSAEDAALLMDALGGSTALRELNLNNNDLGAEGARVVLERAPAAVKALWLRQNRIGWQQARLLAEARRTPGLLRLDLGYNRLLNRGVQTLAHAPWLEGLETLDLSSNGVGLAGCRALARARPLRGLQRLGLGHNPVGDAGAAALAASPTLRDLRALTLCNTQLGRAGTAALLDASWRDHLEDLDLSSNPGLDLGALLDRAHDALPRLRRLDLSELPVNDEHATLLVRTGWLKHLDMLHPSWNALGDHGAPLRLDDDTDALHTLPPDQQAEREAEARQAAARAVAAFPRPPQPG